MKKSYQKFEFARNIEVQLYKNCGLFSLANSVDPDKEAPTLSGLSESALFEL